VPQTQVFWALYPFRTRVCCFRTLECDYFPAFLVRGGVATTPGRQSMRPDFPGFPLAGSRAPRRILPRSWPAWPSVSMSCPSSPFCGPQRLRQLIADGQEARPLPVVGDRFQHPSRSVAAPQLLPHGLLDVLPAPPGKPGLVPGYRVQSEPKRLIRRATQDLLDIGGVRFTGPRRGLRPRYSPARPR
jgi:hypothetical protein